MPRTDPPTSAPTRTRTAGKQPATKGKGTGDGRVRLQRLMADAGVASRRACEEMIEGGRVSVNGEFIIKLPVLVDPMHDVVEIDGRRIDLRDAAMRKNASRLVYVMLYKPRATLTTMDDPASRRTVAELVQHYSGARLYPVGRLDFDTMGLVLMTNDGELANALTHPKFGVHKTYRAIVKGQLSQSEVDAIRSDIDAADRESGQTVGRTRASGVDLTVVRTDATRTIMDITLSEGRQQTLRSTLARLGCPVRKLVRIAMGPVVLKGLRLGEWRDLTPAEVSALRKAVKGRGPKGLEYHPSAGSTAMKLGDPRKQGPAANAGGGVEIDDAEYDEPIAPAAKPVRGRSDERRPSREQGDSRGAGAPRRAGSRGSAAGGRGDDGEASPLVRRGRGTRPGATEDRGERTPRSDRASRSEREFRGGSDERAPRDARPEKPLVTRVGDAEGPGVRRLTRADLGLPERDDGPRRGGPGGRTGARFGGARDSRGAGPSRGASSPRGAGPSRGGKPDRGGKKGDRGGGGRSR